MNYKGGTVLFLCILTIFTYADCTCTHHALKGDNVTFTINDVQEKQTDVNWKKDTERISQMKRGSIVRGDMDEYGSLLLKNVRESNAGKYSAEVFESSGKEINTVHLELCVYATVPKPTANVTCEPNQVSFNCEVKGDASLKFTWFKNGKETKDPRHFKANFTNGQKYKCTAGHPAQTSESEEVTVNCSKQGGKTLFGFDFWIMVGILAGGGGLVLLLTVVLLTCACRSCKRQAKMQQDEEEFRLNNLHTSQPSGQPKSKQTARGQPAPPIPHDEVSINEMPEASTKAQTRPRNQRGVRPPPTPIDEDEQPPPLPQPRKQANTKQ